MITLAEPDPYLLAESKERPTQQNDRESKKDTGSVYVLQPEERAPESHVRNNRLCKFSSHAGWRYPASPTR